MVDARELLERIQDVVSKPLFFTTLLFVLFTVTQLAHREAEFGLQSSIKEILKGQISPSPESACTSPPQFQRSTKRGRAARDVRTLSDVMEWLDVTVIRWLWDEAEGPGSRGITMSFNQVAGGVRVRQQRLAESECPGLDDMTAIYPDHCYGGQGDSRVRPVPEGGASSRFEADADGFYNYWLDIAVDQCQMYRHTAELSASKWLDSGVSLVLVQSLLYNVQIAFFVVLEATFLVGSDGSITPKVVVQALPTQVYSSALLVIGDLLVLLLLFVLGASEALVCIRAVQSGNWRECLQFYRALNLSIVFVGLGFGVFFIYLFVKLGDLLEQAAELPQPPSSAQVTDYWMAEASAVWQPRHASMTGIFDETLRLADLLRSCELWTFWYSLMLMMRFFYGFDSMPKLRSITITLKVACLELAYFMVVFSLIFVNFTLGAYFIFGNALYEWSNFSLALNSAFRTLMGDFDFNAMYAVAPMSAMLWFWLYMWGFFLILLNMFLAIVMDAYTAVRSESERDDDSMGDDPDLGSSKPDVKGGEGKGHTDLCGPREAGQVSTGEQIATMLSQVHEIMHHLADTPPQRLALQAFPPQRRPEKEAYGGFPIVAEARAERSGDVDGSPGPRRSRSVPIPESLSRNEFVPRLYYACWGQGPRANSRPRLIERLQARSRPDSPAR